MNNEEEKREKKRIRMRVCNRTRREEKDRRLESLLQRTIEVVLVVVGGCDVLNEFLLWNTEKSKTE